MGAARSFVYGVVFTLALVVVVPVAIDYFVAGYVEDAVSSLSEDEADLVVELVVWLLYLCLMLLLGAGRVFRKYGVVGVLGVVVAYWLLGDVTDAVLPIVLIAVMALISWWRERRKGRKERKEARCRASLTKAII